MTDCKIREVKREETRKGVTTEGGKQSRRESSGLYCLIGFNFKPLWQERRNYRAREAREEEEDGERE